jgi:hypothetical protein
VPAILLDESTGGFSVLVNRQLGVKLRQEMLLGAYCGWFRVRVVHIGEMELPGDIGAPARKALSDETSTSVLCCRLGLRRLGSAPMPIDSPTSSESKPNILSFASARIAVGIGVLSALRAVAYLFWR